MRVAHAKWTDPARLLVSRQLSSCPSRLRYLLFALSLHLRWSSSFARIIERDQLRQLRSGGNNKGRTDRRTEWKRELVWYASFNFSRVSRAISLIRHPFSLRRGEGRRRRKKEKIKYIYRKRMKKRRAKERSAAFKGRSWHDVIHQRYHSLSWTLSWSGEKREKRVDCSLSLGRHSNLYYGFASVFFSPWLHRPLFVADKTNEGTSSSFLSGCQCKECSCHL